MNIFTKLALTALLFFSFNTLNAQGYNWDEKPTLYTLPDSLTTEPVVIVFEKKIIIHKWDSIERSPKTYRTFHRKLKLIDERKAETLNESYLSFEKDTKILETKVRTIKANGNVTMLAKHQYRMVEREGGLKQIHFSITNLVMGDEIELLFTEEIKSMPSGYEIMQQKYPVIKALFVLECPSFLEFETKGYNGFPSTFDTIVGNTRIYTAEAGNMQGLEKEVYGFLLPNFKRIEYKVKYTGKEKIPLFSWDESAKKMHEVYNIFSEDDLAAVKKFIAPLKLGLIDDDQKISLIEAFIKREIKIDKKMMSQKKPISISKLIDEKRSSEFDIVKLYSAALQTLGIPNEIGFTGNRFVSPLDENFTSSNRLVLALLYFPLTGKYLCPTAENIFYPQVRCESRNSKGLFVSQSEDGEPSAVFRAIPPSKQEDNVLNLKAEVTFVSNAMTPKISMIQTFKGYDETNIKNALREVPKKKEIDLVLKLTKGIASAGDDVIDYSFNRIDNRLVPENHSVEFKAKIRAPNLIQTARDKFVFKVGSIIGPQAGLDPNLKRKLPVDLQYAQHLPREIIINIPKGYKITNPEDVIFNVLHSKKICGFQSSYTLTDRKMTIQVNEYYGTDILPLEDYPGFRDVVNASVDFNNVALLIEKK